MFVLLLISSWFCLVESFVKLLILLLQDNGWNVEFCGEKSIKFELLLSNINWLNVFKFTDWYFNLLEDGEIFIWFGLALVIDDCCS